MEDESKVSEKKEAEVSRTKSPGFPGPGEEAAGGEPYPSFQGKDDEPPPLLKTDEPSPPLVESDKPPPLLVKTNEPPLPGIKVDEPIPRKGVGRAAFVTQLRERTKLALEKKAETLAAAGEPAPSSQLGIKPVSLGIKVDKPLQKSVGRASIMSKMREHAALVQEKKAAEKEFRSEAMSEPGTSKAVAGEPKIFQSKECEREEITREKKTSAKPTDLVKIKKELEEVTSTFPLKQMIQRSIDVAGSSALSTKMKNLELGEVDEPPVIRRGEGGEVINVTANYITLETDPNKGVFRFELKFEPEVDFVAARYKLVHKHFHTRRGIRCYDGSTTLFMPEKITSDRLVIDANHPSDDSPVQIIVTFKQQMRLAECGQLYNILFNNCAKVLHLARVGREYYNYKVGHQIPQHKLEVWPGYVTSVMEFEGGIHLCCDVKHRVIRTETAYDVLENITRTAPENFKNLSLKEIVGQCVLTRYNNNTYRVDDIDWDKTPKDKFKTSNGDEITFYEYYKRHYDLDIMDLDQPLLINKPKVKKKEDVGKIICLVPELCFLTGLTDRMRKDYKVMKEIAVYTRVTPSQRHLAVKKFIENIKASPKAKDMLEDWGLKVADEPINLKARVLPSENIFFKRNAAVGNLSKPEWLKPICVNGVYRSIELKEWLFLHTQRDFHLAKSFCRMLMTVAPGLGLDINDPIMISLKNDRIDSYITAARENMNSRIQMVLFLCPTARDDRYSAIKKLCCKQMPVISQVVCCGTIAKENRLRAVVQNVALQINNKLGGASWSLHVPLKNCMICGIDSYHDAERTGYSVGAFVASIDQNYTRWFSKTCVQDPGQELVDGLISCFGLALSHYVKNNGKYPDRIVIFRDGVGDGQLAFVKDYEIKQFIESCLLISVNYKPKFSYIVVQKRINTKFYRCANLSNTDLQNPSPGSIVDHTITRRNLYDFFLVSQHVATGTATPTHYIVLYDNSELKPEHMQRLAYKFCHLYYNWPGTVRVPAPCQYAHKLAYLVGQHVKCVPCVELDDKLYYL